MKTKFTYSTLFILAAFMLPNAQAQDFHVSQYDMTPLYINPALTGMYKLERGNPGDFRLMADYRSQWQKLQSKPFTSAAFAFDKPIGRFGVGGYIMDNIAGVSNFSTFNFIIGGSYTITKPESEKHLLTTGIQLGILHRKFGKNDLLFSSQYVNSYGLDAGSDNGESFKRASTLNFDSNLGIYYKYNDFFSKFNPFVGLSVYHLNKPNHSITGFSSRTPMRFNIVAGTDIYIQEDIIKIKPSALYMYQGKAQELNIQLLAYYRVKNTEYELIGGVAHRVKDAVILHLGIKQGQNTFRMSYDIVTNKLKEYSGKRGAIELGVIYSGNKKTK